MSGTDELLDALCEAHRQADSMLAHIIALDPNFMPSKSPYWPEFVRRAHLIQKLQPTKERT